MKTNSDKFLDTPFLTDGGLETTLIFLHGIELNPFAVFELLNKPETRALIKAHYKKYLDLAKAYGTGSILETATWQVNPDWEIELGSNQGL